MFFLIIYYFYEDITIFTYGILLEYILESYIKNVSNHQEKKMTEVHKIGIDLLFCFIIGFLTIQAGNSLKQNQQLSDALSQESARITANNLK